VIDLCGETTIKGFEESVQSQFKTNGCIRSQYFSIVSCSIENKKKTCTKHDSSSDFWTNSAILTGSALYKSRLDEFLTPAVGSNPRWVLCYRASTHGWAASTFHSRCDGKRNTVTIIKNGEYVFGGYTDISWGKQYA